MSLGHYEFSFGTGEQIANAITHGVGLLLSIAGLPLIIVLAVMYGDAWHVVSCSIYGSTLVILYAASTLNHGISSRRAKPILARLDYSAIYLLIAGTYTPFSLVTMRGPWGWSLFGVVWFLAILGVLIEIFSKRRHGWLSLSFYIAMGWLLVIAWKPLFAELQVPGIALLAAGGIAYTGGSAFYAWRAFPYHHAIWHLFVLAGSILHYIAVALYVIPIRS